MIGRWSVVCVVVLLAYVWFKLVTNNKLVYPEIGYTIDELVKSNGYPFEYHKVTTSDGYILELHRIPHGKQNKENAQIPPILFMHGMGGCSMDFLFNGPNSYPYYLADRGYDVWLGNARGNFYSRQHVAIDPNQNPREFFDFSWHEIGMVDLPSMIDYILQKTHVQKVFYLGYSQGCTTFYVMMSEKPEYNEKVHVMVGLAPVVYFKDKPVVINILVQYHRLLELADGDLTWKAEGWKPDVFLWKAGCMWWGSDAIGYYERDPRRNYRTIIGNAFCHDGIWTQTFCSLYFLKGKGCNAEHFNRTSLPLILAYNPAGLSMKQVFHYGQIFNSDIFRQYDHGEGKNKKVYGQSTPPLYKLENTKVPVALFHSDGDPLTPEKDIDVLYKSLPNVVHNYRVTDKGFCHIYFMLIANAIDILYPRILNVLNVYQTNISTTVDDKI